MRDIKKYVEEYKAVDYDFEKTLVRYRRKKVLEILDRHKPKNILEIGCGMDSIANYYTNYDNFLIVEPSQEFASKAIKKQNEKIKVYVDFIENKIDILKYEYFDFILLSSLLHEIPDPQGFLKSVVSLCKEETILHINVPNSRSFHLLWAYEAGIIKKMDELTATAYKLQQNTAFNAEKLSDLVQSCGLDILDKGSYFLKPFNHQKMAMSLKGENDKNGGALLDDRLLDGLYSMTKYMPDLGCEIFINAKIK